MSVTATRWEINALSAAASAGGGAGVTVLGAKAPRPERGRTGGEISRLASPG